MSNDNVIHLIQPGIFDDQLTEILRNGARALLAQAVERELVLRLSSLLWRLRRVTAIDAAIRGNTIIV